MKVGFLASFKPIRDLCESLIYWSRKSKDSQAPTSAPAPARILGQQDRRWRAVPALCYLYFLNMDKKEMKSLLVCKMAYALRETQDIRFVESSNFVIIINSYGKY